MGVPPLLTTQDAVDTKVWVGSITSSPPLIPMAFNTNSRAEVHELTATPYWDPIYSANNFSNSLTLGPLVKKPFPFRISSNSGIIFGEIR